MKTRNHLARLALVAGVVGAVSAPVFAQPASAISEHATITAVADARPDGGPREHRGHGERHDGPRGEHHGERGPGPAGHHFLRGLDLTEAQQDKIFSIRHAAMPAARDAMKELRAAKRDFRELTRDGAFDEAKVQAAAQREGTAIAKMSVLRAKTDSELFAVLTPEQKKTLAERREKAKERMEQRREHRGERHGDGPPPPRPQQGA